MVVRRLDLSGGWACEMTAVNAVSEDKPWQAQPIECGNCASDAMD